MIQSDRGASISPVTLLVLLENGEDDNARHLDLAAIGETSQPAGVPCCPSNFELYNTCFHRENEQQGVQQKKHRTKKKRIPMNIRVRLLVSS